MGEKRKQRSTKDFIKSYYRRISLFFLLEHQTHAAQEFSRRDAEGEFEGTVECCIIPEATLDG